MNDREKLARHLWKEACHPYEWDRCPNQRGYLAKADAILSLLGPQGAVEPKAEPQQDPAPAPSQPQEAGAGLSFVNELRKHLAEMESEMRREVAAERLGGNVVKEAAAKGELVAFTKVAQTIDILALALAAPSLDEAKADGPTECREEDGGFVIAIRDRVLFSCSRGSHALDMAPGMTLPEAKSALFALGAKLLRVDERSESGERSDPAPTIDLPGITTVAPEAPHAGGPEPQAHAGGREPGNLDGSGKGGANA